MEVLVPVMMPNMIQCAHGMLTCDNPFFTHAVTFHLKGVLGINKPHSVRIVGACGGA